MQIITDKNHALVMRIAEECNFSLDFARRIVRDWEAGRNLRAAKAFEDQMQVARQNQKEHHRSVDTIGQCTDRMAVSMEAFLCECYGKEQVQDARFRRELDLKHGLGLKPNYDKKARIVMDKHFKS